MSTSASESPLLSLLAPRNHLDSQERFTRVPAVTWTVLA
jgi:hypothetical protein